MISIIICSRKPDIPQNLKTNIVETIGIDYELIVIDNSENKYSIFQAYNEGVRRAKYPYLCFMHEDILFHTNDWGVKVKEHFKDKTIGLIGVVGGHYMPKCPASWWSAECSSGIVLQGISDSNGNYSTQLYEWLNYKNENESSISVVSVDGLWFCTKKELFNTVKFDEITFRGFHCYDLDICMQIHNLKLDVQVIFDVIIEHLSEGKHNQSLVEQGEVFYEKWKTFLPIIKGIVLSENEIEARRFFVDNMHQLNKENWIYKNEINRIVNSKAYRIGKFLLNPFSFFKNKIR